MSSWVSALLTRKPPPRKPLPEVALRPGAQRVVLPIQTRHQVCNPSIMARSEGGYLCIVRGANYNLDQGHAFFYGSRRTRLPDTQSYLMRLSPDLAVEAVCFVEDRHLRAEEPALDGIEDYRLFRWQGATWVLGTARNATAQTNVMVLARLEGHVLEGARFLPSPLGAREEKNWTPVVVDGALHVIYSHHPLRVYRVEAAGLVLVSQTDAPDLERCSGGSCALALPGGGWRSVVHRYESVRDWRWRAYEHLVVDYGPDHSVARISRPFRFEFDGVEFCAGLAQAPGGVVLSYGVKDNRALLVRLRDADFEALFG